MIIENTTGNNSSQKRSYKKNNDTYTLGKLPPQAPEVEEAILGVIIDQAAKIPAHIWGMVKPEIFYKETSQIVCTAVLMLKSDGNPIDELTVITELRKAGKLEMVGGMYHIAQISANKTSRELMSLETYLMIVTEKFLSRELIRLSQEIINGCYDESTNPLAEITRLTNTINDLKNGIFKRTEKSMTDVLDEMELEMFAERSDGLIGSSCGFKGVDYVCQGDQPGQLIIDAGRPGMGKTAFMCSSAASQAFNLETGELLPEARRIPVAIFSLEMSRTSIGYRIFSEVSSIPTLSLKKAYKFTEGDTARFRVFKTKFKESKIFIDDTGGLNIDEFEAKTSVLVAVHGVKKVYIDYLQLMYGSPFKKYGNREAEVSDISRRLKQIAKNLGITIVAACQLSRDVEKRAIPLPVLSDLRESGSIEQDADVVRFLWRPEYYENVLKQLRDSPDGGSISAELFNLNIKEFEGLLFCIVAKCREEKTGKVPLRFNGKIMKVSDHPAVLEVLNGLRLTVSSSEVPLPF
jgi:replicative DNA helicase